MARTATLLSLRTQVRERADIENATTRHTDAQLNEIINQSWADLHEELTISNEDYLVSSTTTNTVAGTDTYALPATFYKLRGIFVSLGGFLEQLQPFALQQLDEYQYTGGWISGAPIAYHLLGANLMVKPTPTGVYTLTIYFTPAPVKMTVDADTVDGVAGWEEFVVWDSVVRVLVRDDRDASVARAEAERLKNRIVRMATMRDYASPSRILNRTRMSSMPKLRGLR